MKRLRFLSLFVSAFGLLPSLTRAAKAPPVYKLRIIPCNKGRLNALLTRFRNHTCKLFEKHGMGKRGLLGGR